MKVLGIPIIPVSDTVSVCTSMVLTSWDTEGELHTWSPGGGHISIPHTLLTDYLLIRNWAPRYEVDRTCDPMKTGVIQGTLTWDSLSLGGVVAPGVVSLAPKDLYQTHKGQKVEEHPDFKTGPHLQGFYLTKEQKV